jgi:hypothetical protein
VGTGLNVAKNCAALEVGAQNLLGVLNAVRLSRPPLRSLFEPFDEGIGRKQVPKRSFESSAASRCPARKASRVAVRRHIYNEECGDESDGPSIAIRPRFSARLGVVMTRTGLAADRPLLLARTTRHRRLRCSRACSTWSCGTAQRTASSSPAHDGLWRIRS